jgi:hypothetical protein
MNSDELLFTAAMEQGTAPVRGPGLLTGNARDYVTAWLRTIDRGCGHATAIRFTALPARSALCPSCAERVGLLSDALHCGRCRAPVDTAAGDYGAALAVDARTIAFVAVCRRCMTDLEKGTEE